MGGTIVTVGSLSKLFWGTLRVGWVQAPRHVITRLAQRKVVAGIAGPVLDQLAAGHVLPRVEEVRVRRRPELRARGDLLAKTLTELLPDWSGGGCRMAASASGRSCLGATPGILPGWL